MTPSRRRSRRSPSWDYLLDRIKDFKLDYKGQGEKGLPVIIDARKQVPWKHVVAALDTCVEAGIQDITFAAPAKPIN